jgi:hypothetical protein
MHSKVFVKLKKPLKPSRPGKKTQKNPKKSKKPKKTKKNQKNPLGWVFLKKPGFFPTLVITPPPTPLLQKIYTQLFRNSALHKAKEVKEPFRSQATVIFAKLYKIIMLSILLHPRNFRIQSYWNVLIITKTLPKFHKILNDSNLCLCLRTEYHKWYGSGMFISDPRSEFFSPDPGSRVK